MGVQVPPPAPKATWNSMSLSVKKVREQDAIVDFKATLVSTDYAQELNSWFSKRSQTVRIDGFRPGKAPLSVVQSRFGEEANRSVMNTIVDRVLKTIDKEHKLRVAGHPKVTVEKANSQDGFECSVSVECLPTVELKDFSSISCEELVLDISKKEVDEAVDSLFKRYKAHEKEKKAGKLAWGDKLSVSIKEKGTAGAAQDQDIVLSEDTDPTWGPLHKGLHGKSEGEKAEVAIVYPKDFQDKNIAGKSFTYEITVKAIYAAKTFSKLDDTFAKEFECDDLAALHKKMENTLQEDQKRLISLYHKRQILDALNVQYKITLPKSAVDHEFQQIWKKLEDEIAAGKARGEKDDVDRKAAEIEYREIAERRVRLGFVISEIAKEHKISLTNEEIQRVVMKEALNYPQQFKEVVDFYVKNKHALERLIAPAIEDKVVDFVFDKSKKKQTKITTQELPTKLKGVVPGYEDDEPAPKKEEKAKVAEMKDPKESKSEGEKAPAKTATTKKGK